MGETLKRNIKHIVVVVAIVVLYLVCLAIPGISQEIVATIGLIILGAVKKPALKKSSGE